MKDNSVVRVCGRRIVYSKGSAQANVNETDMFLKQIPDGKNGGWNWTKSRRSFVKPGFVECQNYLKLRQIRRGLADGVAQAVVRATVFDLPKSFPNSPTDVQQFLYGAWQTRCNVAKVIDD